MKVIFMECLKGGKTLAVCNENTIREAAEYMSANDFYEDLDVDDIVQKLDADCSKGAIWGDFGRYSVIITEVDPNAKFEDCVWNVTCP